MARIALLIIGLLTSSVVLAEVIEYEIYEISKSGNKMLAKGKRDYSVNEIEVKPYERDGRKVAHKFVELEQGFRVGARIFYEKELTGFGLLARRSDSDFSWEWYDKVSANRFRKRQGGTAVDVRTVGGPNIEELAEVRFLSDTELRFNTDRRVPDDTHFILVKAGSVLRLR